MSSELGQTLYMELFLEIVSTFQPIVFPRASILDVWLSSEYASDKNQTIIWLICGLFFNSLVLPKVLNPLVPDVH